MITRRVPVVVLLGCLLLTGCAAEPAPPATQAQSISVHDAWVKAADADMTAAFAHLTNDTGTAVEVMSATASVAQRVELHEVVPDGSGGMQMQPKRGGFIVPARGDLELAPGAEHFMLMGLTTPLTPGTEVELTATFGDGSTLPINAQVRDFPGADEHYHPGSDG